MGTSKAVDPEDATATVTLSVTDITTGIKTFTNAAIDSTQFSVTPNAFGMIGLHTLKVTLTDVCKTTKDYTF